MNRLSSAASPSYPTISFTYSKTGNIWTNSRVGSYTYDPNHAHAVKTAGPNNYSYDANGNMVNRNGATLVYDYDNRLTSIANGTTTSFVYDYLGARVKKTTGPLSTVYIGNLFECTGSSCTKHIFAGSRRIATKTDTETYYYHPDHLGGLNVATKSDGHLAQSVSYYPFGETLSNTGTVDLSHKFTDQENDPESGLYYYGARYYDPVIGRFITPDSIVQAPGNPQTLNRYSYCLNNPVNAIDPTGHFSIFKFFKSLISGIVGGLVLFFTHNPVLAGMAAGAVSGAFSGDMRNVIIGAGMGGLMGGLGGIVHLEGGIIGDLAMLGAGIGYTAATNGLDGLAYMGAGMVGGAIGYYGARAIENSNSYNAGAHQDHNRDADLMDRLNRPDEIKSQKTYEEESRQYTFDDKYRIDNGKIDLKNNKVSVKAGQEVWVTANNRNLLGVHLAVKTNYSQFSQTIIPPFGIHTFRFYVFAGVPVPWTFTFTSNSSAFVVQYSIYSDWAPGMPIN